MGCGKGRCPAVIVGVFSTARGCRVQLLWCQGSWWDGTWDNAKLQAKRVQSPVPSPLCPCCWRGPWCKHAPNLQTDPKHPTMPPLPTLHPAHLVCGLVDFVGGPVDALEGGAGDDIRTTLCGRAGGSGGEA